MPKGLKLSGSPGCNIDRTSLSALYFPHQVKKTNQIKHVCRNLIYLVGEYKKMIDNGQMKNQADLACKLGISRVRICQTLKEN